MRDVKRLVLRYAASDSAVVVLGESGTGKELVARSLHRASHRADGPFVAVNCGAIPDGLAETELFGAERGAFTDAVSRAGQLRAGRRRHDLPRRGGRALRARPGGLLRVLEQKELNRVGGNRAVPLDVRVVSATNRDLKAAVKQRDLPRRPLLAPLGAARYTSRRCASAWRTCRSSPRTLLERLGGDGVALTDDALAAAGRAPLAGERARAAERARARPARRARRGDQGARPRVRLGRAPRGGTAGGGATGSPGPRGPPRSSPSRRAGVTTGAGARAEHEHARVQREVGGRRLVGDLGGEDVGVGGAREGDPAAVRRAPRRRRSTRRPSARPGPSRLPARSSSTTISLMRALEEQQPVGAQHGLARRGGGQGLQRHGEVDDPVERRPGLGRTPRRTRARRRAARTRSAGAISSLHLRRHGTAQAGYGSIPLPVFRPAILRNTTPSRRASPGERPARATMSRKKTVRFVEAPGVAEADGGERAHHERGELVDLAPGDRREGRAVRPVQRAGELVGRSPARRARG